MGRPPQKKPNGEPLIPLIDWEQLIELITGGMMLKPACDEVGIVRRYVYDDIAAFPERAAQYEAAKSTREGVHLEELVTIADSATAENVFVAKLRMFGREKFLSMSNPTRFGAKSTVIVDAPPMVVAPAIMDSVLNPVLNTTEE